MRLRCHLGISVPRLVDGRGRDTLEQITNLPGQRLRSAERVSVAVRIAGDRRQKEPEKATSRNRRDVAEEVDGHVAQRLGAHAGFHGSIV